MNPCISCGMHLKPGSSHAGPSDCVVALRHALEEATKCTECATTVEVVAHPGCLPRLLASRGAKVGVDAAARRALDAVARAFSGERGEPDEGEDEDPGKPRRKGRFVP